MARRITDHIRAHLLRDVHPRLPPLDELRRLRWSSAFEELRKARMVMGAFRYGLKQPAGWIDFVATMHKYIERYEQTGNKEFLLDLANVAMMEWHKGDGKFESTDDEDHGVES